ncbi:hypothetical protein DXG01_012387 [Tephrocybe rancida]|nr:hypothetical protein DXG01_012387 [Tephrocybe rancida]
MRCVSLLAPSSIFHLLISRRYHDWEHFSTGHTQVCPACERLRPPWPQPPLPSSLLPRPPPFLKSKFERQTYEEEGRVEIRIRGFHATTHTNGVAGTRPKHHPAPFKPPRLLLPPFLPPHYRPHPLRTSYLPNDAPPSPLSLRPLSTYLHRRTRNRRNRPATPSQKRALNTADDDFEASSSGSVKRSRRSHISDVLPTPHMDAEEDADGETSTPRLSPPFSESEFSPEPMPPLPPPAPGPPTLWQDRETEKPMTRRQQGAGAAKVARRGPCGEGWWE